jgi:hypothetical protein
MPKMREILIMQALSAGMLASFCIIVGVSCRGANPQVWPTNRLANQTRNHFPQ